MNKEILIKAGFINEVKEVLKGNCPICHEKVNMNDFKDEISEREYNISGLCKKCQDKIFTLPEG